MNLNGVKTLGSTAQKSINGGIGGQARRRRGICGSTPSILCNEDLPSCAGGEVVNGNCYICV